jgi:hypothetical protein
MPVLALLFAPAEACGGIVADPGREVSEALFRWLWNPVGSSI